jgi:predicted enzyme related to lactoylglutathione lyase
MVARNADAMLDFYGKTLGLPLLQAIETSVGQLNMFGLGNNVIKVLVPPTPPGQQNAIGYPQDATGIRYWTVTVKNLDQLVEECVAGGGSLMAEPGQIDNVRFAILQDPDGNCVEFIEYV